MALNRHERRRQARAEGRAHRSQATESATAIRLQTLRQQMSHAYHGDRFAEALAFGGAMLKLTPQDPQLLGMMALIAARLGQNEEALAHLRAERRVLDRVAGNPQSYRGLCGLLIQLGQADEAEAALTHALSKWPDEAVLNAQYATLLWDGQRLDAAARHAEAAVAHAPGDAEIWRLLGAISLSRGDPARAAEAYGQAATLAPDGDDIAHVQGVSLLASGRPQEALEVCDAWLARRPVDIEVLALKGHALQEAGRIEEARRLFDFDRFVTGRTIGVPEEYPDLDAFNAALEAHVMAHPTLLTPPEGDPKYHHPALKISADLLADAPGPVAALEREMRRAVDDYFAALGEDAGHPFVAQRPARYKLYAWAAVLDRQGNQHQHIHKDGYLSGCYYLRVPQEVSAADNGAGGDIAGGFEVGRPPDEYGCRQPQMTRQYRPQEGLMLLFPAYFYHRTIPFTSSQRRICIAFDVMPA
ncbi:MAG: hypothetical protein CVT80_04595 [Alphaproteobacteria bacterium HGW-Alphaproteobacteria-2]|nr:MAG: hypothetical protein CVT80_04595 [Alphaproteobacteria bacterium HGW-Alphaproteobacteria-2]